MMIENTVVDVLARRIRALQADLDNPNIEEYGVQERLYEVMLITRLCGKQEKVTKKLKQLTKEGVAA